MADISKIQMPSGNVYDIKDAVAREMISAGIKFIIAWDGTSTPVVANIPSGVKVRYNSTEYTGTLAADSAQAGAFYLVKSSTTTSGSALDVYDEYVPVGETGSKTWEKIGDTQIDLSDVVTDVSLSKQTDVVLGEATTFALASGSVTHGSLTGHTESALGVNSTFYGTYAGITVTPTTKYLSGSATGGGAAWNSKDQKTVVTGYASPTSDTFVKSVSAETGKNLVQTSVPNVTSVGSASTWSFTMGTGNNAETLIIGGTNGSAPTLGSAITVATGATDASGTGDPVVTGVTIGSSASAITGLGSPSTANVIGSASTFTNTQPTISLTANDSSGTGRVEYMQSATAAFDEVGMSVYPDRYETVDAIVSMPTSSVGTGITVGTNDKVTTLTSATNVVVTKGS